MMYLVRLKGLLKLNEVMGELGKYEVKEPHIKTEQIVVGQKCVNLVDIQATIILKEEFTMNLYYNLQNMIQKAKSITMGTVVRNETLSGDKLKQILPEFTFMQINELKEFKPQPAFNIEEEPKDGNIKSFIDKCKECVENGCLDKYGDKEIEETEPFAGAITGNPDDKCYVFPQHLMGNIDLSNFHDLFIPTITPIDSDLSLEELFKKFWGEKEEDKLKNKLDDAINNLKTSKDSEVQDILNQARKIDSMIKVMDMIYGMDLNNISTKEFAKQFYDIINTIKTEKLVSKKDEKRIDDLLNLFKKKYHIEKLN